MSTKPRMCLRIEGGKKVWWCWRTIPFKVMGCGDTPQDAWDDMWGLYKSAVNEMRSLQNRHFINPREG